MPGKGGKRHENFVGEELSLTRGESPTSQSTALFIMIIHPAFPSAGRHKRCLLNTILPFRRYHGLCDDLSITSDVRQRQQRGWRRLLGGPRLLHRGLSVWR